MVCASEKLNELATALAKAQGEVTGAHKSADNPFFKSKYADLAAVWDACRDPLSRHGLAVIQLPSTEIFEYQRKNDDGEQETASYARVTVTTRLVHSSGEWIEGSVCAEACDAGSQAIGSAITYLRRYALQSMIGIAPEDDDGNAAVGKMNLNSDRPAGRKQNGKAEPKNATPKDAKPEANGKAKDTRTIDQLIHDFKGKVSLARDMPFLDGMEEFASTKWAEVYPDRKLTIEQKAELLNLIADNRERLEADNAHFVAGHPG